ncbi:hypothetical protein H8356DRAFT_1659198, partial [Neocallimastix lanati (nom. inval.)]
MFFIKKKFFDSFWFLFSPKISRILTLFLFFFPLFIMNFFPYLYNIYQIVFSFLLLLFLWFKI